MKYRSEVYGITSENGGKNNLILQESDEFEGQTNTIK